MLPWKQLTFAKFISFRNLKSRKHTVAKFHCNTYHCQEIINTTVESIALRKNRREPL